MRIVADEYVRAARCELSLAAIAARAGVCRKTAKRAMQKARDKRLISIEERSVPGQKHKPNLIRIISFEWLKWLRRGKDNEANLRSGGPFQGPDRPAQVVGGGGHSAPPTDTRLEDDGGGVVVFRKTEPPPQTAPPQSGQPTKEAIAFAEELAIIAGYKPASLANTSLANTLDLRRRPVEMARLIAQHVMSRRRAQDPSPPYSPRYFGPEIYRVVGGIERTREEILRMRRTT